MDKDRAGNVPNMLECINFSRQALFMTTISSFSNNSYCATKSIEALYIKDSASHITEIKMQQTTQMSYFCNIAS